MPADEKYAGPEAGNGKAFFQGKFPLRAEIKAEEKDAHRGEALREGGCKHGAPPF